MSDNANNDKDNESDRFSQCSDKEASIRRNDERIKNYANDPRNKRAKLMPRVSTGGKEPRVRRVQKLASKSDRKEREIEHPHVTSKSDPTLGGVKRPHCATDKESDDEESKNDKKSGNTSARPHCETDDESDDEKSNNDKEKITSLEKYGINEEKYNGIIVDACNEACRAYGVTMESWRAGPEGRKVVEKETRMAKLTPRVNPFGGKPSVNWVQKHASKSAPCPSRETQRLWMQKIGSKTAPPDNDGEESDNDEKRTKKD